MTCTATWSMPASSPARWTRCWRGSPPTRKRPKRSRQDQEGAVLSRRRSSRRLHRHRRSCCIFVVPQFESLFKGFGADLPAFTLMVDRPVEFVQDDWWCTSSSAVVGSDHRRSALPTSAPTRCAALSTASLLKLPVIGDIMYKAAVARFARTLSTMFARGCAAGRSAGLRGQAPPATSSSREAIYDDARRGLHRHAAAASRCSRPTCSRRWRPR